MRYIKRIIVLGIILILSMGCGVLQTSTPGASSNPTGQNPTQISNTAYPGPLGTSGTAEINTITSNQVKQLIIPTPSNGKAVIMGQLKAQGDTGGLTLADLFLSPIVSSDTSVDLSSVTFSNATDPVATIEIGTGRFVFTEINPGKYALMIWTSMRAYPIGDTSGNTIIFTVNPDETKDLGSITIH
jgi:ABC-type oligopeptide transport system substrate-binding subunit